MVDMKVFIFQSLLILIGFALSQEDERATWNDFQNRHLLNPTGNNSGYASWTRTQWNNLLKSRLPADYGTKPVNSFVINSPSAVLSGYVNATIKHNGGTNLYWSTVKFITYVLNLSGTTYNAYRCGDKFVLAGLTSKQPVHYNGYSNILIIFGTVPLNLEQCTIIN